MLGVNWKDKLDDATRLKLDRGKVIGHATMSCGEQVIKVPIYEGSFLHRAVMEVK